MFIDSRILDLGKLNVDIMPRISAINKSKPQISSLATMNRLFH